MYRVTHTGIVIAALCALPTSALAGDLNPPPGAIAPTMLRLDQIEPRRVVNDLAGAPNAVHVISQNGNYVVTAEVDPAQNGQHCILVTAADVTIDLNGFTLRGLLGSLDGIRVDPAAPPSVEDVFSITGRGTVATGRIERGISGFSGNGVTVLNAARVSIAGLSVSNCGSNGIEITTSSATNTTDCRIFQDIRVTGCGGNGIDITLAPSATAGGSHVVTIEDNDTVSNNGHGVVIRGSGFPPPLPGGRESTILVEAFNHDSIANGGDGDRFEFDGTIRASINMRRCRADSNALDGVHVADLGGQNTHTITITDDQCSSNGATGLNLQAIGGDVLIQGLSASENLGAGVFMSTPIASGGYHWRVRSVDASGNNLQGIVVLCNAGEAIVDILGSSMLGNGGNGIDVSSLTNALTLEIDGAKSQLNLNGASIVVSGDGANNLKLKRCTFSNNTAQGLSLGDTPGTPDLLGKGGEVTMEEISASGNGIGGIQVLLRSHDTAKSIIRNCRAIANGGPGADIDLSAVPNSSVSVRSSSFLHNVGDGLRVSAKVCNYKDDDCDLNSGDGFNIVADSVVLIDCRAFSNLGDGYDISKGISAVKGGIVSLTFCVGVSNGGSGISASNSSLYCSNVTMAGNQAGGVVLIDTVRLCMVDSVLDNNTGNGVTTSSSLGLLNGPVTLRRCSFTGNTGTGCSIASSIGGQITECSAFNNGVRGIEVLSLGHVLTGNVGGANAAGNVFAVLPGNAVGPPVGEMIISVDNNFANSSP